MNLRCDPSKDVLKVETFLGTDVASVGLWDSKRMEWVGTSEDLQIILSEKCEQLTNSAVIANIGSDGNFKVILNINQEISTEDKKLEYKSELGIAINSDGVLRLGSPEWSGNKEKYGIEKNRIDTIEIPAGDYVIDSYSLLIRDEVGNPRYLQLVFCVFAKDKYTSQGKLVGSIDKTLDLQYRQ